MEEIKPTYKFAEVPEGVVIPGSPLKKQIAKTMMTTETFTIYEVMQYIAKLKKAIEDKEAERDGLVSMLKAYESELELIENELKVQELEEEFQKKFGESVDTIEGESIESPYDSKENA